MPLILAARLLQTPGGLEDVGRAATATRSVPLAPLLIAAGLVLAIVALRSLARRAGLRAPGGSASAAAPDAWWSVFRSICHARGVGWPGRLLLYRVARGTGLANPLPLLAASGTLYHHGRQYAAGRPVGRRRRVLRGVSRLQRELFAEGRPDPPAPDAPAPPAAPPPDRRTRARDPRPSARLPEPPAR
ncbi:hypothetical protein [Phycisphaera mikurensis]|uniref:hypothetical protein n=1 Tax=Phycisphaera mikurensis TaxID=547188 RepID=UPI0012B6150F|nr:hypothetical protein [Phycisphaera mikurensis]MBB6443382.1 hypothetical protein [Phycisphaera mikurensis]